MAEVSLGVLLPSWWEIEVAVAGALLVIAVYSFLGSSSTVAGGISSDRAINDDTLGAREFLNRELAERDYKVRMCGFSRSFLLMRTYFVLIENFYG